MTATKWLSAPVVIETANTADAETLGDLHAKCFHHAWGTAEFAKLLRQDGVEALIALQGRRAATRKPVGFVLYRRAGDEAEILSIGVDPAARRRDIAKRLMESSLRKLYSDRADHIFLEVAEDNAAATGLYNKLGFKTVGERRGYYKKPDERDGRALVMRIDLR